MAIPKPKYGQIRLTKKEWMRIELALRVDTAQNKKDILLLSRLMKKINLLIDLM